MAKSDALSILADIRASVLAHAAALPSERSAEAERKGLGLQIGGVNVVCPMHEVAEVQNLPKPTRLPGVKEWVLGVANIRGRLVPIIDLHRYVGVAATTPRSEWRIVIVEDGEVIAGLVVGRSLGIQHFAEESFEESVGGEGIDALRPYLSGCFRFGGRVLYEARLRRVLNDERFFEVKA